MSKSSCQQIYCNLLGSKLDTVSATLLFLVHPLETCQTLTGVMTSFARDGRTLSDLIQWVVHANARGVYRQIQRCWVHWN